jgi:hypothetical protein
MPSFLDSMGTGGGGSTKLLRSHPLADVHPFKSGASLEQLMLRQGSDHAAAAGSFLVGSAFDEPLAHASTHSPSLLSARAPDADSTLPTSSSSSSAAAATSSYSEVHAILSSLDLLALYPKFLGEQFDDTALPMLARKDSEDILAQLVPLAGPRIKLRTLLRQRWPQP